MSAKKTQVVLLVGALVLFVLLFIAPKTASKAADSNASKAPLLSNSASIEMYAGMAIKTLEPALKKQLDSFNAAKQFDSIAAFWDKAKRPDLASFYTEKAALVLQNAAGWLKAGARYYYAVQFTQDKTEIPLLYQSAMRCYGKALSMEPGNTDAKIMLASCYVEEGQDPMKGIGLLREVEKTDSNNVKLQLAFAFFSVKSGQLDRAIARFNKVLRADSSYIEAYLHLADAYEQLGETQKTINVLERYSAKTTDITAKLEIDKYIKQLKTNINK
jgi:tetratricopeptide (TPR) repeat protein